MLKLAATCPPPLPLRPLPPSQESSCTQTPDLATSKSTAARSPNPPAALPALPAARPRRASQGAHDGEMRGRAMPWRAGSSSACTPKMGVDVYT